MSKVPIDGLLGEVGKKFLRFRIRQPGMFQKDSFRIKDPGRLKNLMLVVGRPEGMMVTRIQSILIEKNAFRTPQQKARVRKFVLKAKEAYEREKKRGILRKAIRRRIISKAVRRRVISKAVRRRVRRRVVSKAISRRIRRC